jgi:hypothetical protein
VHEHLYAEVRAARMKVAALYVEGGGVYYGLPDVEPWALPECDARQYAGPWPVVAHPPCQLWVNFAALNFKRYGGEHNRPGNDGGCFAAALAAVRTWGGVLEHPAWSNAWPAYGLAAPVGRGWQRSLSGEWVCEVWQSAYGHPARKRTWLLYVGDEPAALDWRRPAGTHQVGWQFVGPACRGEAARKKPLGKVAASATPPAFRDALLGLARMKVAALYVEGGGVYYGLPDVEPWALPECDARQYAGPWPVVAHPPCARWGRYWGGSPTTWPRLVKGDDGGCFAAALEAVRRVGGVLEHPEASAAWRYFGLPAPLRAGGWTADIHGGWSCCVEQGHYGHRARKATWLYFVGDTAPPPLAWGRAPGNFLRLERGHHTAAERAAAVKAGECHYLSHKQRARTPLPFRDLLLGLARNAVKDTVP